MYMYEICNPVPKMQDTYILQMTSNFNATLSWYDVIYDMNFYAPGLYIWYSYSMFNTYTCDANCKATYNILDHVNDKKKWQQQDLW